MNKSQRLGHLFKVKNKWSLLNTEIRYPKNEDPATVTTWRKPICTIDLYRRFFECNDISATSLTLITIPTEILLPGSLTTATPPLQRQIRCNTVVTFYLTNLYFWATQLKYVIQFIPSQPYVLYWHMINQECRFGDTMKNKSAAWRSKDTTLSF